VNHVLYLTRAQVEDLLDVDALLDALARALVTFSAGTTSVPPQIVARVPGCGLMGAMVGYVPGAGLEAKLVSVFRRTTNADGPLIRPSSRSSMKGTERRSP
jgi:ornithine cyclodeaminase/alanine dehydrogenase-like protein (mu-crystallin family)